MPPEMNETVAHKPRILVIDDHPAIHGDFQKILCPDATPSAVAAYDASLFDEEAAPTVDGMAVFGPAPAPLAMLRGRHRQRLLVHASRSLDVQDVIRDWLAALDWSPKVRVTVDVDPYSFL